MSNNWTEEEKVILAKKYPLLGARKCKQYLPGWSYRQKANKASGMGIHINPDVVKANQHKFVPARSKDKLIIIDAAIREHYPDKGGQYVADLVGEKRSYICRKAHSLGVKCTDSAVSGIASRVQTKRQPRPRKSTKQWLMSNLDDIEKLALYLPWGKCERALHEVML